MIIFLKTSYFFIKNASMSFDDCGPYFLLFWKFHYKVLMWY